MNIFVLHPNPRKAARYHIDKHVVKMILEAVQLLYTVHWVLTNPELLLQRTPVALSKYQKTLDPPTSLQTAPNHGYRPVHVRHPCSVWARETRGNYKWLATLAIELGREFRHRYGHEHGCEKHAFWLYHNPPSALPSMKQTTHALAMDVKYRVNKNPVSCYRYYYRVSKIEERGLQGYTNRCVPHWLQKHRPSTECSPD